jgi:hypothetical protein
MKTIIAGSRSISNSNTVYETISNAINEGFNISEVVSGTAEGVDTIGEEWAEDNDINVERFPYEDFSEESGKPAPLIRNDKMAEYAEQAVIVWDGQSKGTKYMIDKAKEEDLEIFIERTDSSSLGDF